MSGLPEIGCLYRRIATDFRGCTFSEFLALVQDDYVVRQTHNEPNVVLDEQYRYIRAERLDELRGVFRVTVAHALGWFVKEQYFWFAGKRYCNFEPSLLAV